jgi:ABC-type amino acid transport substrate-binding protein
MRKTAAFLAALAFAVMSSSAAMAAAAPLRVCFNDHDAPRADKGTMRGFDLDIMRLVAERLGRSFEPVWIESEPQMTEVDESDLPLRDLAKGHCDAVASVPGDMALQGRHDKLTLTRPYYGAAFELVGPQNLPNDLAALNGHKVSVQNVSVANLMAVSLGFDWTAQTSAAAQLAVLKSGKAEAALIWGPELGALGVAPKPGYTPPAVLRWNEHVATRLHDEALTSAIDGALAELTQSGKVTALLAKYGVPAHAPFDKVFSPQDFAALRLGGK